MGVNVDPSAPLGRTFYGITRSKVRLKGGHLLKLEAQEGNLIWFQLMPVKIKDIKKINDYVIYSMPVKIQNITKSTSKYVKYSEKYKNNAVYGAYFETKIYKKM